MQRWRNIPVTTIVSLFVCLTMTACQQGPEAEALRRGIDLVNRGRYDEAITELTNAIQANPTSARAYYNRGRAYVGKDETNQAIGDYSKAIELNNPEIIQGAYNNRGQAYEKLSDFDHALADYTKGIDVMPNPTFSGYRQFQATLRRNRAEIYLSRRAYDKAWEDVQSIKKLGFEVEPEFLEQLKQASGRNQ